MPSLLKESPLSDPAVLVFLVILYAFLTFHILSLIQRWRFGVVFIGLKG